VSHDACPEDPDRLAAPILYESAPCNGPQFIAEATRRLGEFAGDFPGDPRAADVLRAWTEPAGSGERRQARLRRLLPGYLAGYWGDEDRWASLRNGIHVDHLQGSGPPFDHRPLLGRITTPTLVMVSRYNLICPVRWALELHRELRTAYRWPEAATSAIWRNMRCSPMPSRSFCADHRGRNAPSLQRQAQVRARLPDGVR
jgi:pimeloyl-ACP methyl ester carboxylesterase